MITKVTHVTLFTHDQQKTLEFYQKLGFVIHTDAQFGSMRWLTICLKGQKDFEIAIMPAESAQEKALVGKQSAEKPFLSLETTDCVKEYETLSAQGVSFVQKPQDEPWGIAAAIKDLDGNLLYIVQPK